MDKTYQDRLLKTVFHCCCGPIIDLNSECVDGILCWQLILLEILFSITPFALVEHYHDKYKYLAIHVLQTPSECILKYKNYTETQF